MDSRVVNGQVLDYRYKKVGNDKFVSNFYLDNHFIGQLFHMRNRTWSCVVWHSMSTALSSVKGFSTRADAVEYMLEATDLEALIAEEI